MQTPQLTPAEQAERAAHLARQANLRARVDARVQRVRAALQAISSLATNVPHVRKPLPFLEQKNPLQTD